MIIYHGNPNPSDIAEAEKRAPGYDHRAQYDIESFRQNTGIPYILDNGAFNCFKKNQPWDATLFLKRLNQAKEKKPDPDWVVLPDVITDPRATQRRAKVWNEVIEFPTTYPCQDGISPERACELAEELDCVGLFIGGTVTWKRKWAEKFIETAHDHDLLAHVARPQDVRWAERIGADSVDTTNFVRNQSWDKLEGAGEQTTVEDLMG